MQEPLKKPAIYSLRHHISLLKLILIRQHHFLNFFYLYCCLLNLSELFTIHSTLRTYEYPVHPLLLSLFDLRTYDYPVRLPLLSFIFVSFVSLLATSCLFFFRFFVFLNLIFDFTLL